MMLGNAYIDPSMIAQVSYPFYYFGLLSKEQIDIVDPLLKSFQQDIASNNSIAAKNVCILMKHLEYYTSWKSFFFLFKVSETTKQTQNSFYFI